jgi:DNA-directed RNA polymerase subunit F
LKSRTGNVANKGIWDLDDYAELLRDLSDGLLREIYCIAEEFDDERVREFMRKITQLLTINQSLLTLHLLKFKLHNKENERAIDNELYEISEYMSEILDIHLKEADNLRKIF